MSSLVRQPNNNATTQLGVQYSVIRLYSWPEMPRIRNDMVLDVARVCALLAVRPTGVPLIPRLVGLSKERVSHIVEMLHMHGHLRESPTEQAQPAQTPAVQAAETPGHGGSILARLWSRLAGQTA